MRDGSLMVQVNWPVVGTIHPFSNKFVTGVKIKATDESKLNDSPEPKKPKYLFSLQCSTYPLRETDILTLPNIQCTTMPKPGMNFQINITLLKILVPPPILKIILSSNCINVSGLI